MSKLGQNSFELAFSTVFHAGFYWRTPVLGKTERSQPVTSVSGTAAGVVPERSQATRLSVAVWVGSRMTGDPRDSSKQPDLPGKALKCRPFESTTRPKPRRSNDRTRLPLSWW